MFSVIDAEIALMILLGIETYDGYSFLYGLVAYKGLFLCVLLY